MAILIVRFYCRFLIFFFFFCFTEDVTALKVNKPKAENDLNAEETSSEDEDELTQEGHELKDMLERDEGKESWDEDEDEEDPDEDEMKGTSALFLRGKKSWRDKNLFLYSQITTVKVLEVKLEYWLPGITIEASGPRQPVDNGIKTE